MDIPMGLQQPVELSLTIKPETVHEFFSLVGKGFALTVRGGCSIKDLLCHQLGIDAEYVEQRIQTVFLNGKAVDDIETAVVREGAVLALSGAMPGLAGATLRRGGFYGRMRGEISHSDSGTCDSAELTRITIKLFNLIVRELGPGFFQQGIVVSGADVRQILNTVIHTESSAILSVAVAGVAADTQDPMKPELDDADVLLKVRLSP
jgi:hypothetical protein